MCATDPVSSSMALPLGRLDPSAPSSPTGDQGPPATSHHILTMLTIPTPFLSTTAAPWSCPCWQPTENLIKSWLFVSWQLFRVSFHSERSPSWQQAQHNHACAAAGRGSSPKGFPNRYIFTYLTLPWSCYMFINIITTTITPDSFTRATWCICQYGFSWLFSSPLSQKMPETYCENCSRYSIC